MNFICSKQKLQEGISIVTKAITGKTTMPILEGIYIEANNEGVTLIGSDMDVSIETKVEATVITPGKIVLDARLFGEIIRKLPNSDVKIEIAEILLELLNWIIFIQKMNFRCLRFHFIIWFRSVELVIE